jgi:hypothetical protein
MVQNITGKCGREDNGFCLRLSPLPSNYVEPFCDARTTINEQSVTIYKASISTLPNIIAGSDIKDTFYC